MKKFFFFFIIASCLLSFVGCMTVMLSTEGVEKPVAMTSNVNKKFMIVKHFNRVLKGVFTFFSHVPISNLKVQEVVSNEIVAGQEDAVINIKIHGQTTFIDGLVPVALVSWVLLLLQPGALMFRTKSDYARIQWKEMLLNIQSSSHHVALRLRRTTTTLHLLKWIIIVVIVQLHVLVEKSFIARGTTALFAETLSAILLDARSIRASSILGETL